MSRSLDRALRVVLVSATFAASAGAEARHQIGWVIVGGMSFGTLLTLFVVPIVYTLMARTHHAIEAAPAEVPLH